MLLTGSRRRRGEDRERVAAAHRRCARGNVPSLRQRTILRPGSDGQHKAACKAAGAGAMTRTGSEVVPPKEAGNRTSTTYKPGAKVATLRIRYAQKDKLQRLGLLPADAESVG